jgi:hypothetical protein
MIFQGSAQHNRVVLFCVAVILFFVFTASGASAQSATSAARTELANTTASLRVAIAKGDLTSTAMLSKQRIAQLEAMIAADPKSAVSALLSENEIHALRLQGVLAAGASTASTEAALAAMSFESYAQDVSFDVEVMHFDDFDNDTSRNEYYAIVDGERLRLAAADGLAGVRNNRAVSAEHVVRVGNTLLALSAMRHAVSSKKALVEPARVGTTKIAVMMVTFTDATNQPWTKAQVEAAMLTTKNWYNEVSFGKANIEYQVFGWYALNISKAGCEHYTISGAADQAAIDAGVNLAQFQVRGYAFPGISCGWTGLGGGSRFWLNGNISLRVVSHEIGHVFGLGHANFWSCPNANYIDPVKPPCGYSEYGSPYDVMGSAGQGHFHAGAKISLDYLTEPSTSQGFQDVVVSGEYDVEPYVSSDPGVKALRILRVPVSQYYSEYLHVEYRQLMGFDASLGSTRVGAKVQITEGDNSLFDMTPDTTTANDASLVVATNGIPNFDEPQSGVKITLLSADSTKARVRVDLDPCGRTLPLVNVIDVTPLNLAGQTRRFDIAVSNQDDPQRCSQPSTFSIAIEGATPSPFVNFTLGNAALTIAAGQTSVTNVAFDVPASFSNGTIAYYVAVANAARTAYRVRPYLTFNVPQFRVVKVSGDNQSTRVSTAFAQPLRARVLDHAGAARSGVEVYFSTSGGFATLSNSARCTTDASGECQITATARSTPGAHAVRLDLVGNAAREYFRLTNTTTATYTQDTTPAAFAFYPNSVTTGLNVRVTSPTIVVNEINAPAALSVTDGEYSIGCNNTFSSAPTTVVSNEAVCVRHTSATTRGTTKATTLTIGGVAATYSSTTFGIDGAKACMLDADGDGSVKTLSDGVMVLRYLANPSNNTTVASNIAIAANAPRRTSAEVAAFLATSNLDLDGDGNQTKEVDGLLLLRSLMGLTDASVTNGVPFATNSTRRDWASLRAHLRNACGLASRIP